MVFKLGTIFDLKVQKFELILMIQNDKRMGQQQSGWKLGWSTLLFIDIFRNPSPFQKALSPVDFL